MIEIDVPVTITRWFDDEPQPGLVEFTIEDRHGVLHNFHAKVPYVSDEVLESDSVYPRKGALRVTLLNSSTDDSGARFLVVDVSHPTLVLPYADRLELEILAAGVDWAVEGSARQ